MTVSLLRRSRAVWIVSALAILGGGVAIFAATRGTDRTPGLVSTSVIATRPSGALQTAQAAVDANPRSAAALSDLAGAALVRARETGDPTWYGVAERAATKAISLQPDRAEALDALGTLALTRHRFAQALEWSRRSEAAAPERFAPLAIRADALIELGRYRDGFAAVDRRLALRPDLASYSRASYVQELRGDRAGAIQLMELAAESGRPGGEPRTWTLVQLGLLRLGSGNIVGAERDVNAALTERPGDARALAGLARVRAAQGRLDESLTLYDRAIERLPLPEYPAAVAEIADMRSDQARSTEARTLVTAMTNLLAAAGVRTDLDLALIHADQGRPTPADVVRARAAYAQRPGVIGDDILGWVLTRARRCDEGLRYARRSLRLGTQDALMRFHAGMAAACARQTGEARTQLRAALKLNPAFSVRWSPVARATLARLA